MQRIIYPGTFDPITLGHVNIVERAARSLCDELIVAVAAHSGKTPMFPVNERVTLVKNALTQLPTMIQKKIRVEPVAGLLIDFMKKQQASIILRGLRAVSDFEYEFQLAEMNARLAPEVETIFLMAGEGHHFISSQLVKQVADLGGDISPFVGVEIANLIKKKLGKS